MMATLIYIVCLHLYSMKVDRVDNTKTDFFNWYIVTKPVFIKSCLIIRH